MIRAHIGRALVAAAVAFAFAFLAAPAVAQTGAIKGKVVDAQNQPVENAKITIQSADSAARRHETKSNKKGEFFQIGLAPGNYKVTAEKDKLSQSFDIRVRLGDPQNMSFVLAPGSGGGAGGGMSKEDLAKKEAEIRKSFDEAVALNQAGKSAEAIAKFNEIIAVVPKCASCYGNIGSIHLNAKEYDKAEEAYKQATTIDPNFAPGYAGLVNVYNAQRKFAEAEAAAAAAGEGRSGGRSGRRGRRRRERGRLVQPRRRPVERQQVRRSEGPVHRGDQGESGPRGVALHAREGPHQPRAARRGGDGVRDVPEAGAVGAERQGGADELRRAQAVYQESRPDLQAGRGTLGRGAACLSTTSAATSRPSAPGSNRRRGRPVAIRAASA